MNVDHSFSDYKNLRCDNNYYYIYKHLSFDPDFNVLQLFTHCHLKFTPPNRFNDPYDCVAIVESTGAPDKFLDQLKKNLTENLSVTCFNNNPLSILMWSHYAQSHQGFLVEFRIPQPFISFAPQIFNLLKVEYTNEFPKFSLPYMDPQFWSNEHMPSLIKAVSKQYLTKSTEWSYEEEFRVLQYDYNPNQFQTLLKKFPPLLVSSVTLGAKLEADDIRRQKLLSAIKQFNTDNSTQLEIYQAQLMQDTFKLTVPNHPRLDKESYTINDFMHDLDTGKKSIY